MNHQSQPRQDTPQSGNLPPLHIERGRTTVEFVRRWRDRVARRLRARDERRPAWNRAQFLSEFWADHPGDPGAVGLADAFEAAIAAAHGNPARFEQELDCLLG